MECLGVLTTIVVVLNPFHKFVHKRFNAFAVVFCFNPCACPIGMRGHFFFAEFLDNFSCCNPMFHNLFFYLFDASNIVKKYRIVERVNKKKPHRANCRFSGAKNTYGKNIFFSCYIPRAANKPTIATAASACSCVSIIGACSARLFFIPSESLS